MWTYRAKVVHVVDGDTIDCDVDVGFHITIRERFRLARINAPEVRGEEKKAGDAAEAWLRKTLEDNNNEIIIKTAKEGGFGRWIAEVLVDDVNVNDELVKYGHAVYEDY